MAREKSALTSKFIIPAHQVPVNELFVSVQGEGFHAGKAAFFIRFAGCDIGCVWCDSKDAWSMEESNLVDIDLIIEQAMKSGLETVVITGGEPLIFDLTKLTEGLHRVGKRIHIETSGAYPLKAEFDWLTLSPKKINLPQPSIYKLADEMKVVVHALPDLDFAQSQAVHVSTDCQLYLQPQWKQLKKIMPAMMDFIVSHPSWRLGLQSHKFIGVK